MRSGELDELKGRITSRWPTADAFYAERDDRTVRLVGPLTEYSMRPVEIVVDPDVGDDLTVQRIARVVANLTVRWARRVRVVGDLDGIEREMRLANPFFDERPATAAERRLRLFVGPWRRGLPEASADDFQVYALAWTALGRRATDNGIFDGNDTKKPERTRENDVGVLPEAGATVAAAALAGALGAADLFKRAVGHLRSQWLRTFAWDTWSSEFVLGATAWSSVIARPIPRSLNVGRLLIAGVGAIGSALVYIAGMINLTGHITLFDRDAVDGTNLNRSPLFTVLHAFEKFTKTSVAKQLLDGGGREGLCVEAIDGVWRDHAGKFGEAGFDVWVSTTNEDGAWASVPFQMPPVVVHGTTTSAWGFAAGRHIPRVEDCTLCRMPRPEAEFRGPCAEGELMPNAVDPGAVAAVKAPVASLPFLSTASAALVMAMVMQLEYPGAAELPNQVSVDLSVGLPAVITLQRGPTESCRGCKAMRSDAWANRGGRGRYASLTL
jgi:hypothetical protein